MLRYKRWTFEAWYQSECTNIPSLAPLLAQYRLETYFRKIPLVKTYLEWKLSSDFILSFNLTTKHSSHKHGCLTIILVPCKQTYEMHHTSSWAFSPYLCAQNFSWSLSFFISLPICHMSRYLYVSFPFSLSLFFSSLFLSPLSLFFSPFVINDHKGSKYR